MQAVTSAIAKAPVAAAVPDRPLNWHEANELHMTQMRSPLLRDGYPGDTMSCGPSSALMAVRALGYEIGPYEGQKTQKAIDAARAIGFGNKRDVGTPWEIEQKMLESAGVDVSPVGTLDAVLGPVRDGAATAVIAGRSDAAHTWMTTSLWPGLASRVPTFHYVAITGYEPATREYVVNDACHPSAIHVSRAQLEAFHHDVEGALPGLVVRPGAEGRKAPLVGKNAGWLSEHEAAIRQARNTPHDAHGSGDRPEFHTSSPAWSLLNIQHLTNFTSYRTDGALSRDRPTPSSVVAPILAQRLLWGSPGQLHGQRAFDRARQAMGVAGRDPHSASTIVKMLERTGTPAATRKDIDTLLGAAREGHPVVLNGASNAKGAWRWSDEAPTQRARAADDWVTVFGYDDRLDEYFVSDPSVADPMHLPASAIRAFAAASKQPGIVVGSRDS